MNFVYCDPVGHAIEALHYCHGYHRADPDLRISLALSSGTPTELASLCPYISDVFPIEIEVFESNPTEFPGFAAIPAGWDWVVDDGRGHLKDQRAMFPGLAGYYDVADEHFSSTGSTIGAAGSQPPAYLAGEPFRLAMPEGACQYAEQLWKGARPRIAILPAGSGPRSVYPSLRSWRLILTALLERFPDATFCFVGKLKEDGRTRTSFGRDEIDELLSAVPRWVDAVDLALIDQLAVVAACDVLVSPHSGFGMAALAVGAPWLTIAGNKWPEYYYNGVPFYSVLPDLERFPAYSGLEPDPEPVEDDGPRSPSMCYDRIHADLGEIVEGASRLIERRWPYETAMKDHFRRMWELRRHDPAMIWSIDSVHTRYLPTTVPAPDAPTGGSPRHA